MKFARDYRRDARNVLGNAIFGDRWLYALLASLLAGVLISIASGITYPINPIVGGIVGSIVTILITGPVEYGVVTIYLRLVRGEDGRADIVRLFDGFKEKFTQSFMTQLLVDVFVFLWSLLFLIPGIIKSYAYAASLHLLHDRGLEGTAAIDESKRIMYGNKWRLFCLDLSFIGWYIVGMLCLGIGLLWVVPYHEAARAQFFNELLGDGVVVE